MNADMMLPFAAGSLRRHSGEMIQVRAFGPDLLELCSTLGGRWPKMAFYSGFKAQERLELQGHAWLLTLNAGARFLDMKDLASTQNAQRQNVFYLMT
jgi:hypothetical protein